VEGTGAVGHSAEVEGPVESVGVATALLKVIVVAFFFHLDEIIV
jgi:hypothetical protein